MLRQFLKRRKRCMGITIRLLIIMKLAILALLVTSNAHIYVTADKNDVPTYTKISDAVAAVIKQTMPTNQLNAACVSESCPELLDPDLCFLSGVEGFNLTTIHRLTTILNQCFGRRQSSICNASIDLITVDSSRAVLDPLIPLIPVGVKCELLQDKGHVSKLSQTTFNVVVEQGSIGGERLVVNIDVPDVFLLGQVNCEVYVVGFVRKILGEHKRIFNDTDFEVIVGVSDIKLVYSDIGKTSISLPQSNIRASVRIIWKTTETLSNSYWKKFGIEKRAMTIIANEIKTLETKNNIVDFLKKYVDAGMAAIRQNCLKTSQ